MIARALALQTAWQAAGRRVIEVYPYGSKVRLWGKGLPHKASHAGRTLVQTRLATLVRGLADPAAYFYTHDTLDAILAAYTGGLVLDGVADAVGDPSEGVIWLPPPGVGGW
jgi:predicted nuclease with RNAse H fold